MAGRLFGTDGVRGLANVDITAEMAVSLAAAAATVLAGPAKPSRRGGRPKRPVALVGRDTRVSGEFLEQAVVAGLASAGVDALVLGVIPTPGVAYLTDVMGADFGVMLSASHNAMPDNGIKFFAAGGGKLPDNVEDAIEAAMADPQPRPIGDAVGRVSDAHVLTQRYLDHLLASAPHRLDGLLAVVDCAHGAASEIAPETYRRLGAEVVAIHASPDGYNINAGCGSTHMEDLVHAVVEHGADLGIAHDGDADRCLAVDAAGNVVDGDQMMAILATWLREQDQLAQDTVVATVMSNLGFNLAMADAGITVLATAVGDRYVLEAMKAGGYSLGGEQSGHVILAEYASTGDGVLTALTLMAVMAETGKSLADLASVMTVLPQVLINVPGVDRARVDSCEPLAAAVAAAEAELAGRGRVLLRPSGTEPLVRVMVEAPTDADARKHAESLADVVRQELALSQ